MAVPEIVPWIDSAGEGGLRNSMQMFDGNGSQTSFDFSFSGGYIFATDVKAYLYDLASGLTEAVDPVVLTGPSTIEVIPAPTAVNVGRTAGEVLVVYRDTQKTVPLVDYSTGAVMSEENLDMSNKQAVFVAAEMVDRFDAINASSADAIERSFEALTTAQAADAKSNTAIADSAAAVITANAAEVTAAEALQVAEDAVAAATGFNVDIDMYTGNDTTARDIQWSVGSVASPGNKRWELGTDASSNFALRRYNDAGVLQDSPWTVDRATGLLIFAGKRLTNIADGTAATDAATKGQVDAKADLSVVIKKDGTVDFTGHQKLKDSSPTDPLHAASKGYVDASLSRVVISKGTTAGSQTALTFTGLSTLYSKLTLTLSALRPGTSGNKTLVLQLSTDNGATWKSTNQYASNLVEGVVGGAGTASSSTNTSTSLVLAGGIDMSTAPDRSLSGDIVLYDISRTGGGTKRITWSLSAVLADAALRQVHGTGGYFGDSLSTQGFNAFRVLFSDGSAFENGFRWYLEGLLA